MADTSLLIYDNVDFDNQLVQVRILPAALQNFCTVPGFERESVLMKNLVGLTQQTGDFGKHWERAIPAAMELRGRALLRAGQRPTLEQVLPGVKVGLHSDHRELILSDILGCGVCDAPQAVWKLDTVQATELMNVGARIADNVNQEGVELVVTAFQAQREEAEPILMPIFFQMEFWTRARQSDVSDWVGRAHSVPAAIFNGDRSRYYVALCVSRNDFGTPGGGFIYIDAECCAKLLEPFGASPMKQVIEAKAVAKDTGRRRQ